MNQVFESMAVGAARSKLKDKNALFEREASKHKGWKYKQTAE